MIRAVIAIIEHGGNVLVGKKRTDDTHRLSDAWHLPGGRLEADENELAALRREIREETGLEVELLEKLAESSTQDRRACLHYYRCRIVGGTLRAGDDLVDVRYIPKNAVTAFCDKRATSHWPQEVLRYLGQ